MGKECSKCLCENKETIITQHGSENNGGADVSSHFRTSNILLGVIVAVCAGAVTYLLYAQYRRCHSEWVRTGIQNGMQADFIRRMQERMSGRGRSRPTEEDV